MSYRRLRSLSEARIVWCASCGTSWRYGCSECAIHFADYHRTAFKHDVVVNPSSALEDYR